MPDHASRGPGRWTRRTGRGGGFGGGNNNIYAISSGGMVHVLNVQTGEDLNPPMPFLPAGAKPSDPVDRHDGLRGDHGQLRRRAKRRVRSISRRSP